MSKNFRFKQFTIWHDKTAMKVGTDGVLLGAWTDCNNAKTILDIGTGTGLIAIMLAQKSFSEITAIEIDSNAYNQAKENISICKWRDRIIIEEIDFLLYYKTIKSKFDLIVCNPPFFENSLKPKNIERKKARHTDTLVFDELITGVSKIISEKGKFSLILPIDNYEKIKQLCFKEHLYLIKKTEVKPNFDKKAKRVLLEFSKNKTKVIKNILTIEKERHFYTEDYKKLTKDYYL